MFRDASLDRRRLWVHGFLVALVCLLAWYVYLLVDMIRTGYPYPKYSGIFVMVLLILNHVAFNYTRRGLPAKVMKVLAIGWIIPTLAYLAWAWVRGPE
jgi:hypothetical protein